MRERPGVNRTKAKIRSGAGAPDRRLGAVDDAARAVDQHDPGRRQSDVHHPVHQSREQDGPRRARGPRRRGPGNTNWVNTRAPTHRGRREGGTPPVGARREEPLPASAVSLGRGKRIGLQLAEGEREVEGWRRPPGRRTSDGLLGR